MWQEVATKAAAVRAKYAGLRAEASGEGLLKADTVQLLEDFIQALNLLEEFAERFGTINRAINE